MKKVLFLCGALQIAFSGILAQNIVPNPSFEVSDSCPITTNEWHLLEGWNNVSLVMNNYSYGTPDFYHVCGSGLVELPTNFLAYVTPAEGDAVTGLVVFNGDVPNYREYLSCQLTEPMLKGEKYLISLKLTGGLQQNYRFNSEDFGILLSTTPPQQNFYQRIQRNPTIVIDTIINTTFWKQFVFTYEPDSNYLFLTLGSFLVDQQAGVIQTSISANKYSNVFIDDLVIRPLKEQSINDEESESATVFFDNNNKIIFSSEEIIFLELLNLGGAVFKQYSNPNGFTQIALTENLPNGVFLCRGISKSKKSFKEKFLYVK